MSRLRAKQNKNNWHTGSSWLQQTRLCHGQQVEKRRRKKKKREKRKIRKVGSGKTLIPLNCRLPALAPATVFLFVFLPLPSGSSHYYYYFLPLDINVPACFFCYALFLSSSRINKIAHSIGLVAWFDWQRSRWFISSSLWAMVSYPASSLRQK